MLRAAVRPRLLGVLGLALVFAVICVAAGIWQWGVAQQRGARSMQDAAARPAVSLDGVLRPQQQFPAAQSLRPVRARGHYDPSGQTLVSGRVLAGTRGFWVIDPFVVEATGARIPVVRGFVASPHDAQRPERRTMTVTGALAPGEAPSTSAGADGRLSSVDLAELLSRWGGNIYNGFLFRTGESPALSTPKVRTFAPPRPGTGGLRLVNLGYALQWWAFAGFAVLLYVRELRAAADPGAPPDGDGPDNGSGEDDDVVPTEPAPTAPEGSHV